MIQMPKLPLFCMQVAVDARNLPKTSLQFFFVTQTNSFVNLSYPPTIKFRTVSNLDIPSAAIATVSITEICRTRLYRRAKSR